MFADLCFQIVNGVSDLLKDGPLEGHVLDNVHLCTDFLLSALVADEAGAGTREETLRILSEEEDASGADLLLTIFFGDKVVVLSKVLHARFAIADDVHVFADKLHVNIVDSGPIHVFVLVVAFAFVVEQLHALLKGELFALVAHAHEAVVCLIGMKLAACWDVHEQNAVLPAFIVST